MNVAVFKASIEGVTPLLMHRFPMEPLEAIEKRSPQEQAEHAAYRDPDTGLLAVPSVNVQRALVSAAVYSKGKGRSSLQKQAAAGLLVGPEMLSLGVKEFDIDARPVVIKATGGRIIRYRPRLNKWKLTFIVECDILLITADQLKRIIEDMTTRVGLLDFRPEKKGSFGRSKLVSWEALGEVDYADALQTLADETAAAEKEVEESALANVGT